MSVLTGVLKARTTQAGQITWKTTQQGVSHTQSHDLRGNALPSSMSHPCANGMPRGGKRDDVATAVGRNVRLSRHGLGDT